MKQVLYLAVVFYFVIFIFPHSVHAASLISITDTVSRLKAEELSDHTIQFTSSSGVLSGVITISFGDSVSDTNEVDYTDVDLMYGPIGQEVQQVLSSQPGTNVWGVNIDPSTKIMTFAYPTTNGFPILSNQRIIIKIGTNATYGVLQSKTQFHQLKNGNASVQGQIVRIQTHSDSGSLAIPIVSDDSIGVSCQSVLATPTNLKIENGANVVNLSWTDTSDNESGFVIDRSKEISVATADGIILRDTPFDQIIDIHAANSIQAIDDKIEEGTTYLYRVRAYNACGFSLYSNTVTVKTPSGASSSISIGVPSAAPAPLQVSPTPSIQSETKPVTSSQQQQQARKPVESAAPPPASIEKALTPSQSAPNISGIQSSSSTNSITLQWQNPQVNDFDSIRIQRSATVFPQSPTDGETVYSGTASSFTDSGLSAGSVYYYTFFTYLKSGIVSSGSFHVVAVKELPGPIANPVATPTQIPATGQQSETPLFAQASSNLLSAGASGPTMFQMVSNDGVPIIPAVTVTLSPQGSNVDVKTDESQRTSTIMKDSLGGTSAFTIDVPQNAFKEEVNVAMLPLTATQSQIIDAQAVVPVGHEAIGNVIYKIQIKNTQGERIKKFNKPIRLTFRYDKSLVQTVTEESLRVYYWESSLNDWIGLPSHVDIVNNIIVAEVSHATLFSIFGVQKKGITLAQKNKLIVASQSTAIVKRPESYLFLPDDLHLTYYDKLFNKQVAVEYVGQTFYGEPSAVMDICIPSAFFDKEADTTTLMITDGNVTDRYFLAKNDSRQCYETSFIAPRTEGLFTFSIKSKNNDDTIRRNDFSLMVLPWYETVVAPFVLRLSGEFGTLRTLGLIVILFLLVTYFVVADVYQKVFRGRKKLKK